MDIAAIAVCAVLLLIISAGAYLIAKIRTTRKHEIFELYYSKFKLDPPSKYGDNYKAWKRYVNKRLKIKWKLLSIESLVFKGEGSSISNEEALKLIEYLETKRNNAGYVLDESSLRQGIFRAYAAQPLDERYAAWEEKKRIFNGLSGRYFDLKYDAKFPEIVFKVWHTNLTPPFENLIVSGLPTKVLDDYDSQEISTTFSKMYANSGKEWRVKSLDATTIEITPLDASSDALLSEKFAYEIFQHIRTAAAAAKNKGLHSVSYESKEPVRNVKVTNQNLEEFTVHFDTFSDAILTEEGYRAFASSAVPQISSRWPGTWRTKNNLHSNGSIIFKKF